jgi:hypothetical protein
MHQGSEYTDIIDLPSYGTVSFRLRFLILLSQSSAPCTFFENTIVDFCPASPDHKVRHTCISLLLTTPISASQVSMFSCSVLISRALICFT